MATKVARPPSKRRKRPLTGGRRQPQHGFNRIESLGQDFRYGVRVLRLNPGFAATATLSLALGVAANTSIFTLTDQVAGDADAIPAGREFSSFNPERILAARSRRICSHASGYTIQE